MGKKQEQIKFAVIYRFEVKPGKDDEFLNAWKSMTEMIAEFEGGMGSRLHRNENGDYMAYAQWTDQNRWENSGGNLPTGAEHVRQTMRECCEKIETLHQLDVVSDLLKLK